MNRQKEIENAATRIKALKELTYKIKVDKKLDELEKELAWKRNKDQTENDSLGNETLPRSLIFIAETSIEITELREKLKKNKASDLIKIEKGLKDIENTLLDFNKKHEDAFCEINARLKIIKDLRLGLSGDINWKKINDLKILVNLLVEAKLLIIKIQIDEERPCPCENVD